MHSFTLPNTSHSMNRQELCVVVLFIYLIILNDFHIRRHSYYIVAGLLQQLHYTFAVVAVLARSRHQSWVTTLKQIIKRSDVKGLVLDGPRPEFRCPPALAKVVYVRLKSYLNIILIPDSANSVPSSFGRLLGTYPTRRHHRS